MISGEYSHSLTDGQQSPALYPVEHGRTESQQLTQITDDSQHLDAESGELIVSEQSSERRSNATAAAAAAADDDDDDDDDDEQKAESRRPVTSDEPWPSCIGEFGITDYCNTNDITVRLIGDDDSDYECVTYNNTTLTTSVVIITVVGVVVVVVN